MKSTLIHLSQRFKLQFAQKLRPYFRSGTSLAAVAGIVNSVGFIAFGGFVSHISGHATRAAVEFSEGNITIGWTYLLATLVFIGGASCTTLMMGGRTLEDPHTRYTAPTLTVAGILLFTALYFGRHGMVFYAPKFTQDFKWAIFALSFAMGMQNATLRRSSTSSVRNTHMTGTATDVGVALGATLAHLGRSLRDSWQSSRGKTSWVAMASDALEVTLRGARVERLTLHLAMLSSFALGAGVGTIGYFHIGFWVFLLPIAILLVLAWHSWDRSHDNRQLAPHTHNGPSSPNAKGQTEGGDPPPPPHHPQHPRRAA